MNSYFIENDGIRIMSRHWTDYWTKTDSVNSFAEGSQAMGYDDEIKLKWLSELNKVNDNASIVDIGTGNGGLALLIEEYSLLNGKKLRIKGIDTAKINKEYLSKSSKVSFIDESSIEYFDFEPSSVDHFVSQFGFEYTSLSEALVNCLRALATDGTMLLMVHHGNSPITTSSLVGDRVLRECLNHSPLFMQADLLLEMAHQQEAFDKGRGWQNNPTKRIVTQTIQWVMERLKMEFNNKDEMIWVEDVITRVAKVLSQIGSMPAVQIKVMLANTYRDLDFHRMRLAEQKEAAWSLNKLQEVKALAVNLNATFESEEVYIDREPYAWFVTIKKTAN